MKLYGSIASPFMQRVLMAARIKGHELTVELPPGGDMKSPAFRAISPMGRIPVLDDDGWTIAESSAIVAYLDEVLDGPPLLPDDRQARAHARMIDALASNELTGMRPIMACKVFAMRDAPLLVEEGFATIRAGLAGIEAARDPDHAWAAGDQPGIADGMLLPLLTLMQIVDEAAGTAALIDEQPGIAAYYARAGTAEPGLRSATEMKQGFAAVLERRRAQMQAAA